MSLRPVCEKITKYSFQYKMLLWQKWIHLFEPPCIYCRYIYGYISYVREKNWANQLTNPNKQSGSQISNLLNYLNNVTCLHVTSANHESPRWTVNSLVLTNLPGIKAMGPNGTCRIRHTNIYDNNHIWALL